jgi:uncharacterized protein YkwD
MSPKNPRAKKLLFLLVLVASFTGIFFLLRNNEDFYKFKELFGIEQESGILQTARKEISNPGALISKIESARAHLTKQGVFSLTNLERAKFDLSTLSGNAGLDEIAQRRLDDMFAKQYFEHISPAGESASSEAEIVGYEYINIGENIALGNFEDDAAVVLAWMESPGHRANILGLKFTELGVAVGKGEYQGRSTWIAVQIFARPLSFCGSVDSVLKSRINSLLSTIEGLKVEIEKVERELEEMQGRKRQNRDAYNTKVDKYNALAEQINTLGVEVRSLIDVYNSQVQKLNSCLENG